MKINGPLNRSPKPSTPMMPFLIQRSSSTIVVLLFLVTLAYWKLPVDTSNEASLSIDLEKSIQNLRQDDNHLVIVTVGSPTSKAQRNGGCNGLAEALELLPNKKISDKTKAKVAEFGVLCVTDNADNRVILSKVTGIHEALVKLVQSSDSNAAAAACNLIYISTFANKVDHQGFIKAGAVEVLSTTIKSPHSRPHNTMWACAALANLAASYCSGTEDGRCYWDWKENLNHVTIGKSSLPISSDGFKVRQSILQKDKTLIHTLQKLACEKPASKATMDQSPWPGKNAIKGRDEDSPSIVTWAAAGVLKNLALVPQARDVIEQVLPCLCRLYNSPDWLEQNKGEMTIYHVRDVNPCYFGKSGKDYDQDLSCIDRLWKDKDGYVCNDYKGEDCDGDGSIPNNQGMSAKDACCVCKGGASQKSGR